MTELAQEKLQPPRLALVIGSGAVKCAAALGLWKVLAREGLQVDLLVGCSGGSLFAASMALGYDLERCIALTQQLWDRQVTAKRDWESLLRAVFPGTFHFDQRFGMISDRPMRERLEAIFGALTFSDAQTPLMVAATDFQSGEQVVLDSGSLVDALRASIAIPMIFPPWEIGGRLLVDGAVSDPLPVDVAIREGAELIVAMGFDLPVRHRLRS
ncbi:MAG TPA: patatin-like phospholipase family protein [Anaerolineales bacterium]|nr:patatin-like phospholipase family protein [Anaerolineales bacterium]